MSVYVRGYAQLMLPMDSPMAPGHQMALEVTAGASSTGGLNVSMFWRLDGQRFPVDERIWTPDDLADKYELVHHQLHGFDPRGLDPREGLTRLRRR